MINIRICSGLASSLTIIKITTDGLVAERLESSLANLRTTRSLVQTYPRLMRPKKVEIGLVVAALVENFKYRYNSFVFGVLSSV